jgi:hypothetical protein
MKRIALLGLAALAACADAPDVSVPPIAIGGGGARLMTGNAKTPLEAYDTAYSQMTKLHHRIADSLRAPVNVGGARDALDEVLANLQLMRALAMEAERPRFDPFLKDYGEWRTVIARGSTSGAAQPLETLGAKVRSQLHPNSVRILAEFPGGKPEPAKPEPDPAKPKTPEPAPPAPAPPEVPLGILFDAWKTRHAQLAEAYGKTPKGDGARAYGRVIEALAAMKAKLAPEAGVKLQGYLDFYGNLAKDTANFTGPPGNGKDKEENVLQDLRVVSRLIEDAFDPDRK